MATTNPINDEAGACPRCQENQALLAKLAAERLFLLDIAEKTTTLLASADLELLIDTVRAWRNHTDARTSREARERGE